MFVTQSHKTAERVWIKIGTQIVNYLDKHKGYFLSRKNEQQIKIGMYNINYLKVGNGEHNVLCMPGALGTIWTHFEYQIKGFNRDKFTLVLWDPPGYGKSRPPDKDFAPDYYKQDAASAAEFMKALNIPKYSVMAWSNGTHAAFVLAATQTQALRKLVVWGCNSFILPHEIELYQSIRDIRSWTDSMRLRVTEVYGEEGLDRYWTKWQEGIAEMYTTNKGNICKEFLKDIKCPTFVLYGEKDPLIDKVHVTYIQSHITNTRVHIYPEGKHNIHMRYSEDFNRRVQEFLLEP